MPLIVVDALSYAYPDGTQALSEVCFQVEAGERVGVVGANGAGKSTLVNHLCGFFLPQQGQVRVDGQAISKGTVDWLRRQVGVVFQNTDDQLFMSRLLDDVAFGPRNLGMSATEAEAKAMTILQQLGLEKLAHKPPFHLSQGQKRFAAVAGVLAMSPRIIVMDEPTSDLDPRNRRRTMELIRRLEATLLIVSHDLDFVLDTCQRVLIVSQGRLVADGPASTLLADGALLQEYGLELPLRLQP